MFSPSFVALLLSLSNELSAPALVANYAIDARLDEVTHTIEGRSAIRFTNPSSEPTKELYFHLYLNAFSDKDSLFLRKKGGRSGKRKGAPGKTQVLSLIWKGESSENLWENAAPHSPGDPLDRTDIRVPLPREIEGHETINLEMTFTSQLPEIVERTGFDGAFHFAGQWFPKLAKREVDGTWAHFPFHPYGEFYADFGNYEVTVNLPKEYVFGSTGVIFSVDEQSSGRLTYTTHAKYVHDYAWTAWPQFEIEERVIEGTKVRLLAPPHTPQTRKTIWRTLESGLPHMNKAYGPYPHSNLTVVHPPASAAPAGGMEYPQLITTGGNELFAQIGVRSPELFTIHELAHQWFQGTIATNESLYPYLDEGLTSYAEWRFLEEEFSQGSMINFSWLQISRQAAGRYAHLRRTSAQPISTPAPLFETFGDLASLVYSRTPLCLTTLARVYGEHKLHRALRAYALSGKFRHPTPKDLFLALELGMGEQVRQQAELMFNEGATIDLQIGKVRKTTKKTGSTQVEIVKKGALTLPFDVEIVFENNERKIRKFLGEENSIQLIFPRDKPLRSIRIDPERKILLDENLLNNRVDFRSFKPRVKQTSLGLSFATWLVLLLGL